MKLKSFGCSFIFGSDLADVDLATMTASQNTWPALLAQHLKYSYDCYAIPGAGNLQILEQVLNQVNSADNNLFVISWSWIDRYDYYNFEYHEKPWTNRWVTIMPGDDTVLARTYYKELHSEYRDKFTNLSYIKLAIDTLTQKGISFIMTYMDELLFDQRWHTSPAIIDLQSNIKPCMTQFEKQTFLEWSRVNKFPESSAWHPLESAHQAAFELIKNQSFL
jgi:hypothetical protein